MSLKFGIYLVEQRIISPEQFCGLIKIQQEATMSLANIALRKNILTIKQVARVLDIQESNPQNSFIQIAIEEELMDCGDADLMLHEQQMSCPSIPRLVVECGLLTQRQSAVLLHHFEKLVRISKAPAAATPTPEVVLPKPTETPAPSRTVKPRQPKFTQRPVAAQPYTDLLK
jgi:hypothetical protein